MLRLDSQRRPVIKKLWTRDFTIFTLGNIVSVCGNSLAGFAINLMVLDYSNSVFLFILYLVIFNLPKILVPLIAGPFLDSFSRRKTIYTLDFISTATYISLFFIFGSGYFDYFFSLAMSLILGTIDSAYSVAYESLYPVLVAEGNFRKAYSVSSSIMPLSTVMLPVAAFLYERIGISRILLFSAVVFFIAACFETQVRADETHLRGKAGKSGKYRFAEFRASFIEGVDYIKGEKGLLVITVFFLIISFSSASDSLILPYFRDAPHLSIMLYTLYTGSNVVGRFVGGLIQYRIDYPTDKKFAIALFVYFSICIFQMCLLFMPVYLMFVSGFLIGLLSVTSYNIRLSTTQSYVPDAKRARFNGSFFMFMNIGTIAGQLISGALVDFNIPIRAVIIALYSVCVVAVYTVLWKGRRHVIPIYNRTV